MIVPRRGTRRGRRDRGPGDEPERGLHAEGPPRRRDGAARDGLARRRAARRLRGLRDRVPPARTAPSSSRSEPDHVRDAALERRTEPDVVAVRPDPEVPLGPLPVRCRTARRVSLPGPARVHGRAAGDLLGDAQEVGLELRRETYPGLLNVAFTRGFVSSQAFVDHLRVRRADLDAPPGHRRRRARLRPDPPEDEPKPSPGWASRPERLLQVLDEAIADPTAEVRVIAYDLNEPAIVGALEQLGTRLRIDHRQQRRPRQARSAETQAATRLTPTAGHTRQAPAHEQPPAQQDDRRRGHAGNAVVCGSTNFSWRGLTSRRTTRSCSAARRQPGSSTRRSTRYWATTPSSASGRPTRPAGATSAWPASTRTCRFSPHAAANARLGRWPTDIGNATSSVFYSLAFLNQTTGAVRDAIKHVTENAEHLRVRDGGPPDRRDQPPVAGRQRPAGSTRKR